MNNRGQVLVMFIMLLPVILFLAAYTIDMGLVMYEKNHLEGINENILDYSVTHYDTITEDKITEAINKNGKTITTTAIIGEDKITIALETKIKSIFGNIVGIKNYTIKSVKDREIVINDMPVSDTNKLPAGLIKGTAVYINPETASICKASDAVSITGTKTGCMKWHVYKDNGDGTYQLILDHNTTASIPWNSEGVNSAMKEVAVGLLNDISSWDDSLKTNNARLITVLEITEILDKPNYYGAFMRRGELVYFDSLNQTQISFSAGESNHAWLFDNTYKCTNYGCNVSDPSNYGYWTSTPSINDAYKVWGVHFKGALCPLNAFINGGVYGIRPVITYNI